MKTHDEIEAELHALGWEITAGPSRTSTGWKATIRKGTSSVPMGGWTKPFPKVEEPPDYEPGASKRGESMIQGIP